MQLPEMAMSICQGRDVEYEFKENYKDIVVQDHGWLEELAAAVDFAFASAFAARRLALLFRLLLSASLCAPAALRVCLAR